MNYILDIRQIRRWSGILNLALLASTLLLIFSHFSQAKIFYFHLIFILLTFGAFYWKLRQFVFYASFWVIVTSAIVLGSILTGRIPVGEQIELPMLTTILILVFVIARQRAKAEEALRQANEELEYRVAARTDELMKVNAKLIHEITEHKRTEATLRESEERYRHLVELSFEAIAIHSEGKVVHVNSSIMKLLGATKSEEIIGKPIRDFVHPNYWDMTQARMHKVQTGSRGVPPVETKLIRLDGTIVDVEAVAIPIIYQEQPAVQSVIRDITARKQAETERERERARIARDLHDTLGQNLGYLHLKLDEFVSCDVFQDGEGMRQDLARMRDVANQAYELVRSMLAALHLSNSTDLTGALLTQARSVGRWGEFNIQFSTEGQSQALSPIIQQQVLYLCHEALLNVARHANAQQVSLNLDWAEDSLTITLSDDGRGFEADAPQESGHFGLTIMKNRAKGINGRLSIRSSPNAGTKLTLQVPVSPSPYPENKEVPG